MQTRELNMSAINIIRSLYMNIVAALYDLLLNCHRHHYVCSTEERFSKNSEEMFPYWWKCSWDHEGRIEWTLLFIYKGLHKHVFKVIVSNQEFTYRSCWSFRVSWCFFIRLYISFNVWSSCFVAVNDLSEVSNLKKIPMYFIII